MQLAETPRLVVCSRIMCGNVLDVETLSLTSKEAGKGSGKERNLDWSVNFMGRNEAPVGNVIHMFGNLRTGTARPQVPTYLRTCSVPPSSVVVACLAGSRL